MLKQLTTWVNTTPSEVVRGGSLLTTSDVWFSVGTHMETKVIKPNEQIGSNNWGSPDIFLF